MCLVYTGQRGYRLFFIFTAYTFLQGYTATSLLSFVGKLPYCQEERLLVSLNQKHISDGWIQKKFIHFYVGDAIMK